jgi:hypothetical protein
MKALVFVVCCAASTVGIVHGRPHLQELPKQTTAATAADQSSVPCGEELHTICGIDQAPNDIGKYSSYTITSYDHALSLYHISRVFNDSKKFLHVREFFSLVRKYCRLGGLIKCVSVSFVCVLLRHCHFCVITMIPLALPFNFIQ